MKTERVAWAVRVKYPDHISPADFLAGRYWFHGNSDHPCPIAVFETRREARAAASEKRNWFTKILTPVKVKITVEML